MLVVSTGAKCFLWELGETKERELCLYLVHQLMAMKLFGDFGDLEGSLREQLFGICPVIKFDSAKSSPKELGQDYQQSRGIPVLGKLSRVPSSGPISEEEGIQITQDRQPLILFRHTAENGGPACAKEKGHI